jgi:excisionase family DNA binding protein
MVTLHRSQKRQTMPRRNQGPRLRFEGSPKRFTSEPTRGNCETPCRPVPSAGLEWPMTENNERLETPKQLAKRVGISERQVRHLLQTRQIQHVKIGCRVHIPEGAFRRFLASKMVQPCQDETKAQSYVGSESASVSTSPGPTTAAAASAQLALKARVETPKQLAQRVGITDGQIYLIGAN